MLSKLARHRAYLENAKPVCKYLGQQFDTYACGYYVTFNAQLVKCGVKPEDVDPRAYKSMFTVMHEKIKSLCKERSRDSKMNLRIGVTKFFKKFANDLVKNYKTLFATMDEMNEQNTYKI